MGGSVIFVDEFWQEVKIKSSGGTRLNFLNTLTENDLKLREIALEARKFPSRLVFR